MKNPENLPVFVQRVPRGDQRTAGLSRLDYDRPQRHAAQDPVSTGKVPRVRPSPQGVLRYQCPVFDDLLRQMVVLPGIDYVYAAAHDGDGPAPGVQGSLVGYGVDAPREAAHYRYARSGDVVCEPACDLPAIGGGSTRAHDRDRALVLRQQAALDVKDGRDVVDLLESSWIGLVVPGKRLNTIFDDARKLRIGVYLGSSGRDRAYSPAVQPRRP